MKYVLMVGPKLIPTDGMIMEGSRYLLNAAGVVVNEYIQINDYDLEFTRPVQEPTHIIVLGTPWLWHKCHDSIKYINLHNIFGHYPDAKRLFLGIGSCLPIDENRNVKNEVLIDTYNDAKEYIQLFLGTGGNVIVRDNLAVKLLHPLGVINLPCPAHWALHNEPTTTTGGPVMIWYNPALGISKGSFIGEQLEYYYETFKAYYRAFKPTVYCINQAETVQALNIGLPEPRLIQDVNHAKIILANAERVISGRVHMAVPSKGINKPVELIAVDTRANTLYDHLNKPNESLDTYKAKYVQILQSFLS